MDKIDLNDPNLCTLHSYLCGDEKCVEKQTFDAIVRAVKAASTIAPLHWSLFPGCDEAAMERLCDEFNAALEPFKQP